MVYRNIKNRGRYKKMNVSLRKGSLAKFVILSWNAKGTTRPFVFIPSGVKIGDEVFIGPGVNFTNDKYPKAKGEGEMRETVVEDEVSIGAGAVVLPSIKKRK